MEASFLAFVVRLVSLVFEQIYLGVLIFAVKYDKMSENERKERRYMLYKNLSGYFR